MSGLLAVLIFGVGYPLMAIAVWSIGAFGISATLPELRAEAKERAKREWGGAYHTGTFELKYQRVYANEALLGRWLLTIFAGLLWPIAVPVWIGWQRGTFITEALAKRGEYAEQAA